MRSETGVATWLSVVPSIGRGGVQRNAESIARELGNGSISHIFSCKEGKYFECGGADDSVPLRQTQALASYDTMVVHNHGSETALLAVIDRHRPTVVLEYSVWGKPNAVSEKAHGVLHFSHEMEKKYLLRSGRETTRLSARAGAVTQDAFFTSNSLRSRGRDILQIAEDQTIIGRVGQPHLESKWHPGIVAAFKQAARRFPSSVLLLVGPHESVRIQADRQLLKSQYRIIEWVDSDLDLVSILDAMDIYAHWSAQGETFGISVVEAMARGLPIVTMRVPSKDNSQLEFFDLVPNHPKRIALTHSGFTRSMRYFLRRPQRSRIGALSDHFSRTAVTERVVELATRAASIT